MSDKKLLEEQTIRRFMKLAKIDGLADGFVETNSGVIKEGMAGKHKVEKATEELEEGNYGNDMEEMGYGHEEKPMQEEELGDLEMGGEEAGGDKEEMFKKVVQAVADALGVDASIEGDEGDMGGDEELPDMDMDMSDKGSDEEEEDEEEEEQEEELDEAKKEEEEEEEKKEGMDEQLAEAVLARVKARLLAEAKAAKMHKAKKEMAKGKIASKKAAKKPAPKAGAKVEEASKAGHSTGKAAAMNFGVKGGGKKGVGNVAKSSAKKGNLTPAKSSTKHTK